MFRFTESLTFRYCHRLFAHRREMAGSARIRNGKNSKRVGSKCYLIQLKSAE